MWRAEAQEPMTTTPCRANSVPLATPTPVIAEASWMCKQPEEKFVLCRGSHHQGTFSAYMSALCKVQGPDGRNAYVSRR